MTTPFFIKPSAAKGVLTITLWQDDDGRDFATAEVHGRNYRASVTPDAPYSATAELCRKLIDANTPDTAFQAVGKVSGSLRFKGESWHSMIAPSGTRNKTQRSPLESVPPVSAPTLPDDALGASRDSETSANEVVADDGTGAAQDDADDLPWSVEAAERALSAGPVATAAEVRRLVQAEAAIAARPVAPGVLRSASGPTHRPVAFRPKTAGDAGGVEPQ